MAFIVGNAHGADRTKALEGSHIGIEGVITPVLSPKRGPYLELAATEPLRALKRAAL
jgi:hypothetical protein